MDRRTFLERFLPGLTVAGLLALAGCEKKERSAGFGNEDRLWRIASGEAKWDEPIVPAYAKDSPALFRDASMAKPDASFVPKVSGG